MSKKKDYAVSLPERRKYQSYRHDLRVDIRYDMDIVDQIVGFYLQYRSFLDCHMQRERPDLYDYIMSKTKCLDAYEPEFITRMKFVMETMTYVPRCGECGRELDLHYVKPTHNWPNFCNLKHRAVNQEFMKRRSDLYFEKTGYRHQMQNPDVVKRLSDTVFSKTGYRYSFQDPAVKSKSKQTLMSSYGVSTAMDIEGIADKARITIRTNKYNEMMADNLIRPMFTLQQFIDFDRESDDRLWWQCLNPDCMRVFNASIAHGIDSTSHTYARCPFCFPKAMTWSSAAEIEIADYCRSVVPPGWSVYNNDDENWDSFSYQFDILVKNSAGSIKCAIEYNGNYYHSVKFQAEHGISYDRIMCKTRLLENFGIPLIHIYEDEWHILAKQVRIKSFIRNVFDVLLKEQCFDIGAQSDVIKLSRDKFSKALPIRGYTVVGEEPPVEIKRGNNMVLNCGKLIYRKV